MKTFGKPTPHLNPLPSEGRGGKSGSAGSVREPGGVHLFRLSSSKEERGGEEFLST
jgi:hypothetical protein